jgi:hypothetical protein
MEKTSSVVSHNGGKPFPLYPTMETNLFRCIPQQRKLCSIVGYNKFFKRTLAAAVVNFEPCHIDFLRGLYIRYNYPVQVGLWGRIFSVSQRKLKP